MFENTKKSTNKYVSYSIHNLYTLLLVSIQQNSQKLQTKFSNLPNKILKSCKQNSQNDSNKGLTARRIRFSDKGQVSDTLVFKCFQIVDFVLNLKCLLY